ncbi:MAG TPA: ABC transporter ATP-binding protein [Patescibacteria group bacterium]
MRSRNTKIKPKMRTLIDVCNVFKSFQVGVQNIPVLKDVSFEVKERDFVIIHGPSGCGKSTLLYTLLGLEVPTGGFVYFFDTDFYKETNEDQRAMMRKKHIGMVYQQSNWVKSLNVLDNVALPLLLKGASQQEARIQAVKMLQVVHMDQWAYYHPTELSSGQQQKVAVARALITDPDIIVADEPTGNLDYESGMDVLHLLGDLNHLGKAVVMVTHDLEYLKYAKTIVKMKDGQIVEIYDESSKRNVSVEDQCKKLERFCAVKK